MGAFEAMGAIDKRHREEYGITPARMLTGRAGDLAAALIPLNRVKPILKCRYLVKGWLDQGAFSVVYGESNVGKTFLAMDIAMHVAAGMDWHEHRVPSGATWLGPVVYIASEGGTGIHNRVEAMRRDNPDLMRRVDDQSGFLLLKTGLDLCTSDDSQWMVEAIGTLPRKPSLIVVDTLARAMGNGDENTAKDMGQFVRSIDHLREATGAHVMVIHHRRKDATKGARGSGSLRAAADTEIELTRNDTVIMAETRKQRDMPCDNVFAYQLKSVFLGFDDDGDSVSSAIVAQTDIQRTDKRTKLSGRTQVALDALKEVISENGRIIKSPNLPNVPVVDLDAWRAACDHVGLTDSDNAQTQARIFRRHRDTLMDKDRIRIWEGYVWLADKADRQRTDPERADNPTCPRPKIASAQPSSTAESGQTHHLQKSQQNRTVDNADNLRTPADLSEPKADGHGHPPIRGVPCPPRTDEWLREKDPDAFDPEMWR